MVSFHLNQYIPSPDEASCLECKQSWDFGSPPMTTSKAYIALNIMHRIGPVRVRRLTEAFGLPATVLTTPFARLQAVSRIGPEAAKALTNWDSRVDFPSQFGLVKQHCTRVIKLTSPDYPALLREIQYPPTVLYMMGDILQPDRRAIGFIATRKDSPRHQRTPCRLAREEGRKIARGQA